MLVSTLFFDAMNTKLITNDKPYFSFVGMPLSIKSEILSQLRLSYLIPQLFLMCYDS